jgi:hypothetical protein
MQKSQFENEFCFAACNLLIHCQLCQQIGDVVELQPVGATRSYTNVI